MTPLAALKLVALKAAIPLVAPSAAALLMVMVEPAPEELATVSVPDRPSRETTPPEPPPLTDKQLAKLSTPEPLVVRHWALVPSAVGKVKVKLLPLTPDCRVTVLLLVEFLKATEPVLVEPVPSVKEPLPCKTSEPLILMTLPLWVMIELAIVWAPVKTGIVPLVPLLLVVTPPARPEQLAAVVQTV